MKIIVDTSVWIEYFNNHAGIAEELDRKLLACNIYIVGPIVTEILQGAKTNKDYQILEDSIDGLPFIETSLAEWKLVGEISFKLRRKGLTIPVTDCIIAAAAINHGASVMTYDRHFKQIPGVKLEKIPNR